MTVDISNVVVIKPINEVYVKVIAVPGILSEINDLFSFKINNAHFNPKVKRGYWKGVIHLFKKKQQFLLKGHIPHLKAYCEKQGYQFVEEEETVPWNYTVQDSFDLYNSLNSFTPREYQVMGLLQVMRHNRKLFRCPTGSGKSFLAYAITKYLQKYTNCKKGLIIVPSLNLVEQMTNDFVEYGENRNNIHQIYEGQDKNSTKFFIISTWQSLIDMPTKWFSQFDYVIGDECHLFNAKSLMAIMNKLSNAKYRIGMTGSLDGTSTHQMTLEGLFGSYKELAKTTELQEKKELTPLTIKALVLDHSRKAFSNYEDELQHIISSSERNNFLVNLAKSREGNTLVLFARVETHGQIIYELMKRATNRPVYFVSGSFVNDQEIHGEKAKQARETVRKIMETESEAIVVASYGVFSTGINIKKLHNLILASPTKSRIRVLQSIGRVLRLHDSKEIATVYDIVDNFQTDNTTKNHFLERIRIYLDEGFEYSTYRIPLT